MEASAWKASSGGLGTCGTESAKSVKPAEFLQDRSAQPWIRFDSIREAAEYQQAKT